MSSPPAAKIDSIRMRPICEDDMEFMRRLYASTREVELSVVDWDARQKDEFLRMQFEAQHTHYQKYYAGSDFFIIERDAERIGRFYMARFEKEFILIDIALTPEWRNKGIGTPLIQDFLDEAKRAGKPVHLHVEKFNPAQRLYKRLGFSVIEDRGVNDYMEWRSNGGAGAS